jgi:uncharacterized membrane protein
MRSEATETDRVIAFSDGVFAVIITVLVLDLRPPEQADLSALHDIWPTAVSYAVSYLFIAIVWVNHHHLLRFADTATSRLIWGNFAHLFSVSLIPFSTAWIADTHLAAQPVSLYAAVFMTVNITYLLLCWEVIDRRNIDALSDEARRMMRRRSLVTIALFATASVAALLSPIAGLALICFCLLLYLRPDAAMMSSIKAGKGSDHG